MGSPVKLGDIAEIARTRLVIIRDVWTGYSPHSPVAALYELRRAARGSFDGEGRLSTAIAKERAFDVAVTASAAKRFLDELASATVVPGAYEPRQDRTDDYPNIEVTLIADALGGPPGCGGTVVLYSESQGKSRAPWGACVAGDLWTLPGEQVGRAVGGLREPLKWARLDHMRA